MKTLYSNIIQRVCLTLACALVLFCSCTEELEPELDFNTPGKDVELTIPINMPAMEIMTRAAISDADCNGINSLWIAVFDAVTGKITSVKNDGSGPGWYNVTDIPKDYTEYQENKVKPVTIKTKSGQSYIVAVANVDNDGVTSDDLKKKPLRELLTDDLTWEGFNKIGVASFSGNVASDIDAPDVYNGLPMSGCFTNIALDAHPDDWSQLDFQTVTIPSSKTGKASLDGAIHLRRLISHITFNIMPDDNIVDMSVDRYTIYNAPEYSWLYERGTSESNSAVNLGSNFGDQSESQDKVATYYHAPVGFASQYITTTRKDGKTSYSFDFWLAENKHKGNATVYNQRELKSISSSDGVLYTSLTGDTWSTNNLASYVTIYCNVTYKDEVKVDEDGNINNGSGSECYRTGTAEYTIHLGYIGDETVDESIKASDFNSYRNRNYIYNIKIKGLNEIVVEANNSGERNSVEGLVTDVENPSIMLDAHYACFNVVFTEEELKNTDNFGYLITTYESGIAYQYNENNSDNALSKYIDWIEVKSTTDETTLADYYPAKGTLPTGKSDSDRVLPIYEFYKKVKSAVESGTLEKTFTKASDGKYYFTVFVNEYTYEPRYGDDNWGKENLNPNWLNYVNEPARHFYFRVRRSTSNDGNSVYARSKYAVIQQSIQTYYSTHGERDASKTAVGIEHINENQGLNIQNTFKGTEGLSNINGRYNVSLWTAKKKWDDVLQKTKMLKIKPVKDLQNGPAIASLESGWNPASGNTGEKGFAYLSAPAAFKINDLDYNNKYYNNTNYDPQPDSKDMDDFVDAINSCMNRNRDENGNGDIDNQELKWYVPASGKYLRAILGRNSLTDPIMPYNNVSKLLTDNAYNTRYLMYASDDRIIWAMEGTSMSNWNFQYCQNPWNVRCIRNLGTNLVPAPKKDVDQVERAYSHDNENRKVIMKYYDQSSIRTYKITKSGISVEPEPGKMNLHPVTDPMNKVYYAFKYSAELFTEWIDLSVPENTIKSLCSNSAEEGEGWRIPNQKELVIMRNLGLFEEMNENSYAVSCTYDYFTKEGTGSAQGTPKYYKNNTTTPDHKIMGIRRDAGTRLPDSGTATVYYRCVRDVEVNE